MWRKLKQRYYQMKAAWRLILLAQVLGSGLKGNVRVPHGWMGLGLRILNLYRQTRKH
jgi:hypothetical protein